MNAKDIMTSPVITVRPDTPLDDVLALLLEHRISGVLVVEDGQVVGTVGDGDLLHRHELGTDTDASGQGWWQRLTQSERSPDAFVRANGMHARDVMVHDVVPVDEDTPLATLAALFEKRSIRRLPVLRGGALVGLVTRADIVRALARAGKATKLVPARADDEAIRSRLLETLTGQPWWEASWSNVFVDDGVVTYVGLARSEASRDAARVAAEGIPGVRAIEDRRIPQSMYMPML